MLNFLLLVFSSIQGIQPPAPTPEIGQFIKQLGDNDFDKRQEACQQLIDLKYKALRGCLESQNHPDPEIARHCKNIVEKYYDSVFTIKEYPSIYLLPNNIRFPYGVHYTTKKIGDNTVYDEFTAKFDLGEFYFVRARNLFNLSQEKDTSENSVYSQLMQNSEWESDAMKLYIRDLIYFGKTKQDIEKIIDQTKNKINLQKRIFLNPFIIPGPAVASPQ